MGLQPAAGARDLNPREVESNRRICDLLAEEYRLWGYEEVAPPTIERLDALRAGGAIEETEVLRLASEDPLGLRPELTAPIVRAAGSRLTDRPRPLRLWACGTTFRRFIGDGGSQRIDERLQSGVELLGVSSAVADGELMHLLLAAVARLGLQPHHQPTLLVGHHGLLDALIRRLPAEQRRAARAALTDFDPLTLAALSLPGPDRQHLQALLALRGEPAGVLYQLEQWLGPTALLQSLATTLESVGPAAARLGVRLQLDPTFQPHFDLYDGLVLKLVCRGRDAPRAIASGGRYDALVGRFCSDPALASGTGFGFDIEAIRDLLGPQAPGGDAQSPWLVAARDEAAGMAAALERMGRLHRQGQPAELCTVSCASQQEADRIAAQRGCRGAIWLDS
jgi:ATP phosphoribosyltransferase regulatory subunit